MTKDDGILIDEATIRTIALKRARSEGETEPRVTLVFEAPLDRVQIVMSRLSRAYHRDVPVTLRLDFPEQLQLDDARKNTASDNGHEKDAGKLSGVTPIGERASERAMRETEGDRKKKKGAETPA